METDREPKQRTGYSSMNHFRVNGYNISIAAGSFEKNFYPTIIDGYTRNQPFDHFLVSAIRFEHYVWPITGHALSKVERIRCNLSE